MQVIKDPRLHKVMEDPMHLPIITIQILKVDRQTLSHLIKVQTHQLPVIMAMIKDQVIPSGLTISIMEVHLKAHRCPVVDQGHLEALLPGLVLLNPQRVEPPVHLRKRKHNSIRTSWIS